MLQQRTRVYPALGKGPQVREQLVDWVKHRHTEGIRVSLGVRLFSSEGPNFTVTTMGEDLAAFDRFQKEDAASADYAARSAKLTPLVAQPISIILLERLLDSPTAATGTTIGQIAAFSPKPGSGPAMRKTLESFVRDRQGSGTFVTLWQRLFSSDGPMFAIYARYPDLAALDVSRKANAPAVADLGVALGELSRAPVQVRLFESIVSMPPPR